MFVVGTERDHVAPWHSVHKIHLLTGAEITFALTSGGHNAGIVSEPGHKGRSYRVMTREACGPSYDPEAWQERAEDKTGSWWTAWGTWLTARSGAPTAPPAMGATDKGFTPLADARGLYEIGRAHVCTPVTHAQRVCRRLLEIKRRDSNTEAIENQISCM